MTKPFGLLALGILASLAAQAADPLHGKMERLAYNQPDLKVDLGVGLWAWPLPSG